MTKKQTVQDVLREAVNLTEAAVALGFTPESVEAYRSYDYLAMCVTLHYGSRARAEDVAKALDLQVTSTHNHPATEDGRRAFAVVNGEYHGVPVAIFGAI